MIASEMAGRKSNDPPPPAENERQATQLGTLLKQFVRVAAPYWSSEDKGQARLRLAAVFVFALGCTGVSVLFNFLYRDFYNAIASKDEEAFLRQLLWFLGATVGGVPVFVFRDYLRDTLALRWRAWMTTDLLSKYFQHRTFYNIQSQSLIDNPDQRINDDVDDFTTTSLTFSLALVNAIVDLISFSGILYSIYPPLFAVLLAYSLGGTAISVYLGRELVGLNFLQEKKEADFRYGLVRARENAESIAFYGGERSETRLLLQRFRQSFANYSRLLVVGRNLNFFTSNYRYLIQLLPAAVVAPLYFRGEIEFGVINQSFSAFNHVLGDFSIIVFQFQALSQFSATVERLGEFQEVLDDQSKPAALPASSAASPAATAGTAESQSPATDSAAPVAAGGKLVVSSKGEKLEESTQATAAEAAAEHLASLFNSFITIENVILPASSPFLPPALLPASASSSSSSASPRVLLEVDALTLCTPQYASCLLSGLSLSVKQGEHLLVSGARGWGHLVSAARRILLVSAARGAVCVAGGGRTHSLHATVPLVPSLPPLSASSKGSDVRGAAVDAHFPPCAIPSLHAIPAIWEFTQFNFSSTLSARHPSVQLQFNSVSTPQFNFKAASILPIGNLQDPSIMSPRLLGDLYASPHSPTPPTPALPPHRALSYPRSWVSAAVARPLCFSSSRHPISCPAPPSSPLSFPPTPEHGSQRMNKCFETSQNAAPPSSPPLPSRPSQIMGPSGTAVARPLCFEPLPGSGDRAAERAHSKNDYNENDGEGSGSGARGKTEEAEGQKSEGEVSVSVSVEGASVVKAEGAVADVEDGVMDAGGAVFFVPQRPYMVLGSLRQQLLYPTWSELEEGEGTGRADDGRVVVAQREGGEGSEGKEEREGSMEGWWTVGGLMQRLGIKKDADNGGTGERQGTCLDSLPPPFPLSPHHPTTWRTAGSLKRLTSAFLLPFHLFPAPLSPSLSHLPPAGFPPTSISTLASSPHNMAHRPQPSDEELLAVLDGVRLRHVAERQGGLDAQVEWASVLSLGEQQRLAFARLLLSRPELALMDESTSALDEENEAHVYGLVEAAGVTFISIGHRSSLHLSCACVRAGGSSRSDVHQHRPPQLPPSLMCVYGGFHSHTVPISFSPLPQAHVYGLVEAAGVTFISIGHRSSLRRFHSLLLTLTPAGRADAATANVTDDITDRSDGISSGGEGVEGKRVVARGTGSMWTLERIAD
ncbi:unnamed protein product [Closterium sp. Naga37s-1]|nr:unnamed protein product [Closterium sp. Naga37s-1]